MDNMKNLFLFIGAFCLGRAAYGLIHQQFDFNSWIQLAIASVLITVYLYDRAKNNKPNLLN